MERNQILKHKDISIVYSDYSDLTPDEAAKYMELSVKSITSHPPKSVYTLLNIKGMRYNTSLLKSIKEMTQQTSPFVLATAVIGVSAITKMIVKSALKFSERKITFLDTAESAKDWLYKISQE